MNESYPEKMKCIILEEYSSSLSGVLRKLKVTEKKIRKLEDNEVLIKMKAAPCNPSDVAFIRGMYNITKKTPVVPGFEGTGTVISAGSTNSAQALLGKKVSCFSQDKGDGTWAEYVITSHRNCIENIDDLPDDQAACLAVNPFTAYAMFEIIRKNESVAFIQNAAGGQIGKFLRKLAGNEGIQSINIVRKPEQVNALKQQGEEFVLNQNDENFPEMLRELAHDQLANIAFDAVGGAQSGLILNKMPDNSKLILYGGLSSQPAGNFDLLDIIFHRKSLTGFNLGDWLANQDHHSIGIRSHTIQDLVLNGILETEIQEKFKLDNIVRALLQYIGHMSEGKVLIEMD